jgi:hypothetical protein
MKENVITKAVAAYLAQADWTSVSISVHFRGREIDLYAISKSGETLAVEAKDKNWRRAFQQALYYRMWADYVYVAMNAATVARVIGSLSCFIQEGIGILAVSERGGGVLLIRKADRSGHCWEREKGILRDRVRQGDVASG